MASFPVLTTCHAVVKESQFVHVAETAISQFLDGTPEFAIPPPSLGPIPYHYFDNTEATAQWLFVLDTVNHCFWAEKGYPRWEIAYGGEVLSGYWALAASLKRAMEEGIPIHQARTLATLELASLEHIFRGNGRIPLLKERLTNLRQSGEILLERFQGDFINVLEEACYSAIDLVLLLAAEFPSYKDVAAYQGDTVYFLKRAQLLAHDLWSTFSGASYGDLTDLDKLTAFADYKLPQVLRHLGIISYVPELASQIDKKVLVPPGSPQEVEIRAATVWSVELLRRELNLRGQEVTSCELDSLLWHLGQNDSYCTLPYHRTKTIFY